MARSSKMNVRSARPEGAIGQREDSKEFQSRTSRRKLLEMASSRQGVFTTADALKAGYSNASMDYQVKTAGNWEKWARGIYQLVEYPPQPWPEVFVWSLWSRDSKGNIQGIISHATAAKVLGLVDVQEATTRFKLPEIKDQTTHMIVSKGFSRLETVPESLTLHPVDIHNNDDLYEDLKPYSRKFRYQNVDEYTPREIIKMEGYRVTSPIRTIIDLCGAGYNHKLIEIAITNGILKGMFSRLECEKLIKNNLYLFKRSLGLWEGNKLLADCLPLIDSDNNKGPELYYSPK